MKDPMLDPDQWDTGDPAVVVADGNYVRVAVRDGCLSISDGVSSQRRERLIPRIGHPLTTLVILGRHGYTTYEAQRWMADLGIGYAEMSEHGVLAVRSAGLRDWRAITGQVRNPLPAMRYLIAGKLESRAVLLESRLDSASAAKRLSMTVDDLRNEDVSMHDVRGLESQAGKRYWGTWAQQVSLPWHPRDLRDIPGHWTYFKSRHTLRRAYRVRRESMDKNIGASDPLNAMLNYTYTVGASACYTASYAYGLEPCIGLMHENRDDYDALIWDLVEPLRPKCEELILDYIRSLEFFDRNWCHEIGNGAVELDPPLTHRLAGWYGILLEHALDHTRKVRDLLR